MHRSITRKLLYVVVVLSMVIGLLPHSVLAAQAAPESPTLAPSPVAPSEQADNWPISPSAVNAPTTSVLDPSDMALEKAMGGIVDAELFGGGGLVRLEPLTSNSFAAPSVYVPQPSVSPPMPVNTLAETNSGLPQAHDLTAFANQDDAAEEKTLDFGGLEAGTPTGGELALEVAAPILASAAATDLSARASESLVGPVDSSGAMQAETPEDPLNRIFLPTVFRNSKENTPPPATDEVTITPEGGTLISTDGLIRVEVPAGACDEPFILRYTPAQEPRGGYWSLDAVTSDGDPVELNRSAQLYMRLPETRSGKPLIFRYRGENGRAVSLGAYTANASMQLLASGQENNAEYLTAYVQSFGQFTYASLDDDGADEGDDELIIDGYCWMPGEGGPNYLFSVANVVSTTEAAAPTGDVLFLWEVEDEDGDGEPDVEWAFIDHDPDPNKNNFTGEPDFVVLGFEEIDGETIPSEETPVPYSTPLTTSVLIYEPHTLRYDFYDSKAYFTPGAMACATGCEDVPPSIASIRLTQLGRSGVPGVGIGYLVIDASDESSEFTVAVKVNGNPFPVEMTNSGFGARVLYNLNGWNVYEITVTDACGNEMTFPPISAWGADSIFNGSFPCISRCGGWQGWVDDPINTQNGNYFDSVNDLTIPGVGGANIVLNRDYNSKSALWTGGATVEYTEAEEGGIDEEIVAGPPQYFGTAWTFPYAVSVNHLDLTPLYDGVEIHYPDGHSATFVNEGGVYVSTSPANFDTLTRTADGWTLLHKNTLEIEYFDAEGRLVEKQDRNGNSVFLTYDGEYLSRVENDSGRWIEFGYTADGYIETATALENRVISYTYTDDLLTSVTDGNKHTIVYDYDENKQLKTITTPKGHTSLNQVYDDKYRIDWQQNGRAEIVDFEYSEDGLTTTTTDNNGYPTINRYNDIGQLIGTEDALGYTEEYGYNEKFQRIYYKDKMGREWHWTYDDNGNRLTEDGPLGWHQEWTYNNLNRVTSQITKIADGHFRETRFDYDDKGNLTTITNAHKDTSTITYDSRGLPTHVYDFNDNETLNTYDPVTGDLTKARNGAGDEVEYAYDGLGRMVEMTDGNDNVYTYIYDDADNLTDVNGPMGYYLGYRYDANDNLRLEIDPNGGETEYWHDESELVTRSEDQLNFPIIFEYDDMDKLIRLEDAEGREWTYDYDAVYNRVAEHGPEDTHTFYVYDGVGNLTDLTRCNSELAGDDCPVKQVTHYDYDDLDRVVHQIENYVSGVPETVDTNVTTEFAYDLVGNLLTLVDANDNPTIYRYDDLDRLIFEQDAEQQETEYGYDANGNLISLINPRDYETTYTYEGANRLETTTDALLHTWTHEYDGNGNLTGMIDPLGVVTHNEYDPLDRLSSTTLNYVEGGAATTDQNVTTYFEYDLAGNLTTVHDPRGGYVTRHQYDAAHRRTLTIDAELGETEFGYDKVNNLTSLVDGNDHATTYEYDGLNRQTKVTNPELHSVEFKYDRLGNLLVLTDARSNQTTYEYDGMNRLVLRVDALLGEWEYEYDAVGNLLAEIDANGHPNNTYTYDKVYRPETSTDAEGYTTSYTYDKNGNILSRTDGNNHTTDYAYDELDRLSTLTNPEIETTEYRYDAVGNQTHLIEADGIVTLYGYDPLYRLNVVTQNYQPGQPESADVNVDTHYGYDEVGNLLTILDAEEHTTTFSYDGLNRLVQEVDANDNTWDYEYDFVGNRTVRIDAKRNRTDYAYYDDNQLKLTTYHDGTSVAYTYDENNNRRTMVDSLGTTEWEYDALNRVTDVTDPFGRHLGYAYDPVSNRTGLTYADGRTVNYGYYDNNWLETAVDPEGNTTTYERDGVGQTTRTLNPNSTISVMAYDKADRLLSLINYQVDGAKKTNSAFNYTYNEVGHRTRVVAEYAWRKPNKIVTSDYTYDGLRRLVRDDASSGDEGSEGVWTDYEFDRVGNRLLLRTNDDSLSPRPFDEKTLLYSYNDINQVVTIVGDTHPGSPSLSRTDNVAQAIHAFHHEVNAQRGKHITEAAADNLLALADALLDDLYDNPAPGEPEVAAAIQAIREQVIADRASGEIDSDGVADSLLVKLDLGDGANNGASGELQTTTFLYDANGNRVNKEFPGPQGPRVQGTDYGYDPENRLVEALDYQMNLQGHQVEGAITTLEYDGSGQRLVKTYDSNEGNGGAKRVEYVFDGLDPVAEYNIWNPQYENFYRGDRGRIITMQHFPDGTQGQMFWYHYDGLGSVSGLTKQQGQSSHNYRYEPYGQIEMPPGNFTDPHNHYTFTGQEWDENMGLYEFYARQYDPVTGVWLSQDNFRGTQVNPASLHRYSYVANNPTSLTDLYGYSWYHGPAGWGWQNLIDPWGKLVTPVGGGIDDLPGSEQMKKDLETYSANVPGIIHDYDLVEEHSPNLAWRGEWTDCNGSLEYQGDHPIDRIVMHMTDNKNYNWTKSLWEYSGASAHYVIDTDGTIYHLIPDNYAAQHAGGGTLDKANSRSIGIEVIGIPSEGYTDAQKEASELLVKSLVEQHNLSSSQIISHKSISPEGDGQHIDGEEYLDELRQAVDGPVYELYPWEPGYVDPYWNIG